MHQSVHIVRTPMRSDGEEDHYPEEKQMMMIPRFMTNVPSKDYEAIYTGSNSITREVGLGKVKCGELMAIHRMFFRLDTLSQELLQQPELVKHVIVVADVVEIEGSRGTLTLPGSSLVLIFCRILILKSKDVVLDLGSWDLRVATTTSSPLPRCSIRAQQVVISSGSLSASLLIQVKHEFRWSNGSHLHQYFGRPFSFASSEVNSFATTTTRTTSAKQSISSWPGTAPASNLILVNSEKFNVLVNAVPWKGVVDCQAALPSLDDLLHPHVISGIQSTLLIVETILNYQTNNPSIIFLAQQHAEWIVDSLLQVVHSPNSTTGVPELKTLLARAQMLVKLPTDGSQHLRVPLLVYGEYQEDIDQLLRNAEAYDQEYRELTRFVQHVQIIGSEFLQLSKSLAQKERQIETFESLSVIRKQSELDQVMRRIDSLTREIERRSFEMADARYRMEEGVMDHYKRQVNSAVFGMLGALLQLFGSLFGGAADIAGAMATTVSAAIDTIHAVEDASASSKLLPMTQNLIDLEKMIEVVNAVNELVESATELEDIIHAPELPLISSYTWDILENDIEELAALMPSEVSEVVTWKAKCRNLVAVCREICIAANFASEVQYELFVHARQQEMARRQAERLEGMQLATDLSSYIELATQADMRTTRLLLSLLNVLAGHQGALHYHYLMELEVFTFSWPSVDSVRMHLLQLNQKARARENMLFGPGVLTVQLQQDYVVDAIPVSLLLSGEDWSFTINPERNASVFPAPWDYVRIRYVEMKFTGEHQPLTQTGEVYLLLRSSANFQDRFEEQVLEYEAAVPLVYQYAYNLATGATTLPNLPYESGKFFRMTPFTRWRLRLSASAYQNEGVSFPTADPASDSHVQITITFYVTALPQIQTRISENAE
ncbi:hypothetical protein GOP47_0002605 [Adiantum capillus-veneris]|uniref:Uncharacterized protein n=1 Tax=Adiantum capillus-veneris TaxID=13818 RepID=A0A9D4VAZ3_ADICA|nr:hypothetical protein GOP47_0002605 [Adiantum capillus-veneris]